MRIGIVGHEGEKFTELGRQRAKEFIRGILNKGDIVFRALSFRRY